MDMDQRRTKREYMSVHLGPPDRTRTEHTMTPTSELSAVVRAIDATVPYINPAAAPGTPEWFLHTAAVNLRDATRLFEDCITDLEATE